jgi:hypothetical protein
MSHCIGRIEFATPRSNGGTGNVGFAMIARGGRRVGDGDDEVLLVERVEARTRAARRLAVAGRVRTRRGATGWRGFW